MTGSGVSHLIVRKKQVEVVDGDSFQSVLNGVIARWQAEEKNLKKD